MLHGAGTVEHLYNEHVGDKFWPLIIMRYVAFNLLRVCFVHKLFIWDLGARGLYIVLEPFLLRGIPLFYTDQSS